MGTPRGASSTLCFAPPELDLSVSRGPAPRRHHTPSGRCPLIHRQVSRAPWQFSFRVRASWRRLYSVRLGPSGVKWATCHLVAPSLRWSCHSQPSDVTSREKIIMESSAIPAIRALCRPNVGIQECLVIEVIAKVQ